MTAAHVRPTGTAEEAPTPEGEYHFRSDRLPHQLNPKEVRRCFPAATAAEEVYGEEDQTPEAELADPAPALERQHRTPAAQRRAPAATGRPPRRVGFRNAPAAPPGLAAP